MSIMFPYRGVVVGGEDNGQFISCSRPRFKHLALNRVDFVHYIYTEDLKVWQPADQSREATLTLMADAYQAMWGKEVGKLKDHIFAQVVAHLLRYPRATQNVTAAQMGVKPYMVRKAMKFIQEEYNG